MVFAGGYLLNAIPLGTCEKAIKPVNTGRLKHVTKTLKNAEKIPDPVVT